MEKELQATLWSLQETQCQETIGKNLEKLRLLGEQCERLNSHLDQVVTESHNILDNSFFSSKTLLTNHVATLNHDACLDIVMAMDAYSEYMVAVREMVEAETFIWTNLLKRCDHLALEIKMSFF